MNINYKSKQLNKGIHSCSAMRRALLASLIVLGFLCVFWPGNVLLAFNYDAVKASITFVCQKTVGLKNNSYEICIKPESDTIPVPDRDTIIIDGSGNGEFLITLTEPGTYNYILYQKKGTEKGITYDDAKYEVHVFVTSDSNGKLNYSVSITYADSDTKPTDGALFKNIDYSEDTQEPSTEQTTEQEAPKPSGEATTEAEPADVSKKGVLTEDKTLFLFMILMVVMSLAGIAIVVRAKIREAVKYSNNEEEGNIKI
ncbi:pilin isopeptide linkage domain-containing protein [Lachnospiraceae bacterium NE2001]|nr:pilin isopeptide linkage domain-containing protein [Lachnospiraceae bacterium NE2001]